MVLLIEGLLLLRHGPNQGSRLLDGVELPKGVCQHHVEHLVVFVLAEEGLLKEKLRIS